MTRRRNLTGEPRQFLASGSWPDGPLVEDAPTAAVYAREISLRLQAALVSRTKVEVAEAADLSRTTLHDMVTGRRWPDVVSLAKLEDVLGVRLWPS